MRKNIPMLAIGLQVVDREQAHVQLIRVEQVWVLLLFIVRQDHPSQVVVQGEPLDELVVCRTVQEHKVLRDNSNRVASAPHILDLLSKSDDVNSFFPLDIIQHHVFLPEWFHARI